MSTLLLVTADKGGVGKSLMARVMLDCRLRQGRSVQAFDTDKTNSTLFRFYEGEGRVKQLDFEQPSELDRLLNELSDASKDQLLMVDCAARSLDYFLKWMKDVDFFTLKDEIGFKVTLVFVLGPEKDCISILKDTVSQFQHSVNYIIVKNFGKGSSFDLYEKSNTRKTLLEEYGAAEIELPALLEKTTLLIDRLNISFEKAIAHPEVQIADRSRIRLFRDRMKERLSQGVEAWL